MEEKVSGPRSAAPPSAPERAQQPPPTASEPTPHEHDATQSQEESRSERALRVSQLDADEMDHGLIHMLNAKIARALSVFGVSFRALVC